MVGHTHEDIDQMFSCISSHLRRNSIHDLQGNSVKHFGHCERSLLILI